MSSRVKNCSMVKFRCTKNLLTIKMVFFGNSIIEFCPSVRFTTYGLSPEKSGTSFRSTRGFNIHQYDGICMNNPASNKKLINHHCLYV